VAPDWLTLHRLAEDPELRELQLAALRDDLRERRIGFLICCLLALAPLGLAVAGSMDAKAAIAVAGASSGLMSIGRSVRRRRHFPPD
jgi:hypothetical protein